MGWIYVLIAASLEILGVIGLKIFSQKRGLLPFIYFIGGFILSYFFLYLSLEFLDISVAYAVWMGIGTAGAVIINMVFFGESKKLKRILSLVLIIIGVIGLKIVS